MIKIIGRIFINVESEGWMAENADLFITEGVQRNVIGNKVLPQLKSEIRQKHIVRSVEENEQRTNSSDIPYSLN